MSGRIFTKAAGLVLIILGVLMIFNSFEILSKVISITPTFFMILKLLLELISGIFILSSGIEILKVNKKGQRLLIFGTIIVLIKSIIYFEVRNYVLLVLLILICIFKFRSYLKVNTK